MHSMVSQLLLAVVRSAQPSSGDYHHVLARYQSPEVMLMVLQYCATSARRGGT